MGLEVIPEYNMSVLLCMLLCHMLIGFACMQKPECTGWFGLDDSEYSWKVHMWGDSESNQAPVSVLRQSDFDCMEPLDKENIHSISLFDFDIHHVNDDAFSGMSRLEWLTLYNFGLTTIPSLGLIKDTLSEIDFSYNQISHIPDDYFEECGRLTEILL